MGKKKPTLLRYTIFQTEWGYFGLAATSQGLIRSHLPCPERTRIEAALVQGFEGPLYDKCLLNKLQEQVRAYFARAYVNFSTEIPIVLEQLSPFTQAVLRACRRVRFGRIISYGQLAQKAGHPAASRAVGSVLAKNPLPLIIPCHRVICADGKIGGFSAAGGITVKKRLLQLEQSDSFSPRG